VCTTRLGGDLIAAIIVNRGLQVIGGRAFNTADSFLAIQTLSVDDKATAFVAGDTTLGTPTNELDVAFDSTPTRAGQVITTLGTIPSTSGFDGNTVKRIAWHNDTTSNVSGTSTTLCGGVDGQTYAKVAGVALRFTLTATFT